MVDFVPDFAQEPRLLAALEQALATVVADLRGTGLDGQLRLVLGDGEMPIACVQYRSSFGRGAGLVPSDADSRSPVTTLVLVADELQEAVMESLSAAWPVRPAHDLGAHAREKDHQAVWWCEGEAGHVISAIGKWSR